MPVFSASSSTSVGLISLGSVTGLWFHSRILTNDSSARCSVAYPLHELRCKLGRLPPTIRTKYYPLHASSEVDGSSAAETNGSSVASDVSGSPDNPLQSSGAVGWDAARTYRDFGLTYGGKVEGHNRGGLKIKFHSLMGFLPFSELCPSRFCKEPESSVQMIAQGLVGSVIAFKVIEADEGARTLVFSEARATFSKYSEMINVGDIFEGRIDLIFDYGAFVHLRFPDGNFYLKGLLHVSEISWDFVRFPGDILNKGDNVRVKVVNIDREKRRILLSIKQLAEDPLLETLGKAIHQGDGVGPRPSGDSDRYAIEPLPGLKEILEELSQEQGITGVKINRQGFERRVVSPDLQIWLSNAPSIDNQVTLLARAGRQVQEIQLTTSLDHDGVRKALQRALERVP
ncbi:hypothetical protein Dimus_002179 [Dionaea muscipula]